MVRNSTNTLIFIAIFFLGLYSLASYSYKLTPQQTLPAQVATSTTFSATPTSITAPLAKSSLLPELIPSQATSDQALIAFIDSPPGPQNEPYLILTAYFSDGIKSWLQIR